MLLGGAIGQNWPINNVILFVIKIPTAHLVHHKTLSHITYNEIMINHLKIEILL